MKDNDSHSSSDIHNEVEISVKKEKTLFGFEDFEDLNTDKPKSQKTSKRVSNSQLKKSFDSSLPPSQQKSNNEIQQKSNLQINMDKNNQQYKSPKFGSGFDQEEQSLHGKTYHQFTLRPNNDNNSQKHESQHIIESRSNAIKLPQTIKNQYKNVKPSKSKSPKHTIDHKQIKSIQIQHYQNLCSQIKYYEHSTENLFFQNKKLYQQIQDIKSKLSISNNDSYRQTQNQIKYLNSQIQQQRSIEKKMSQVYLQLQQQYQELGNTINNMQFNRPEVVNSEIKVIVDQINALRSQFDALNRDEGSLNLSVTLQPQFNIINKNQLKPKFNQNQAQVYEKQFKEIYQQQKKSQDPKFIYNLKMACLKQQWYIFNNNVIQINVSYRYRGVIIIMIGNKVNFDLNRFSLIENQTKIIQNEVLAAKSYYSHKINLNKVTNNRPFVHIIINYSNSKFQKTSIKIFIPNMILKYGQFIPFTKKQFQAEFKLDLSETITNYRPIDKMIIKNLSQISLFIPNLVFSSDGSECQGIIKFNQNNGSLIQIQQKGQSIRIWGKNVDTGVIKTIEFLFTL